MNSPSRAHATRGRTRRNRHGKPALPTAPDHSDQRQVRGPADAGATSNLTGSSAVLDEAHLGDIEGALGRIRVGEPDDQRRTIRRRLLTFLAIMGPGISHAAVHRLQRGGVLSTSYAFGDFFGMKHSLHRSFGDAKGFYTSFTALVVVAGAIVLIPGAPLGVVTEAVQALAGLLLPSASVFLLLLCNDQEILGPWTNRGWLNIVATIIIATLLMLSGTLMVTTIFPHLNTG